MNVSVICTVLNEGESIKRLLDSLVAQTRQPDELVFVDGGSTDNTVNVINSYRDRLPLRVKVEPGANISRGRNIAIAAAAGPIIAGTDAGVRLSATWLAELISPFEADSQTQVVAGFFEPDVQTPFEIAMGATVLPRLNDINPQSFLPSSRSIAFVKSAWQEAGGYPEWLDYCEDLIFDLNLKTVVGSFAFAPKAVAFFKPRTSLRAFYKQYYLYARGDGKADLWRKRHAIRYGTYLIALPLLIALGLTTSLWWWLVGAIVGSIGMFYTPYRRLPHYWASLNSGQKLIAAFQVPIIRITGDIAKMIGYPVGRRWRKERIQHDPRLNWLIKRGS